MVYIRQKWVYKVGMIVLFGILLLAGCAGQAPTPTPVSVAPPSQGTRIEPPREVADFTLTSHEGKPFSLSDLRGKPVILYFGYTFCPDICPTSLATFVRVKRGLAEEQMSDEAAFVFVSVDSERDTPQVLARYLSAFDEGFIGLTGDEQMIRKIGVDYGLFFQKSEVEGTSADYLIDHTAASFLIDPQGRLSIIYPYGTPYDIIRDDLLTVINKQQES